MRQIKVLIVEDSMIFRELMVKHLNADPSITVVAAVENPFEAREAIIEHKPDVMTLDIELPKMNGIDFLKMLMPQNPMPVIVISSLSDKVFEALRAGAVDFVAKPTGVGMAQIESFIKRELPLKIKVASVARLSSRKTIPLNKTAEPIANTKPLITQSKEDIIVAIGASTGGPEAIATVIKEFGSDIPGVVMVQHMPPGFTEMYAKRLNKECAVTVKEAKNGDRVLPGQVLLAPGGDTHMRLIRANGAYQVTIRQGEKVNGHSPSVDVLFHSVAEAAKERAIGIILTGMGGDGSKGLLAMKRAGARTIGQDEATCVVYGMPKVAYDIGAVEYQERLPDITGRLYSILNEM